MPSRLIPAYFDDSTNETARAFARHIQELLGLSQGDIDKCLSELAEYRTAYTTEEESRIFDRLDTACTAERPHLVHTIHILDFFVKGMLREEIPDDDYKHWVDDLLDRKMLDSSHAEDLRALLERIFSEELISFRIQNRKRKAAGGVLPVFKNFGYTVEMRSIREAIYDWGTDVSKYQPEVLGLIQVASIHIGVDKGPDDHIYFQAVEEDVNVMISTLEALKKDWAALREHLQVSDDTGDSSNA